MNREDDSAEKTNGPYFLHYKILMEERVAVLQLAEAKTTLALHDSVQIYIVTYRPIVKVDVHFLSIAKSEPLELK